MKYNKRGVTLVSVLIIILVLSILSYMVVISTEQIVFDTFKKEFSREYKLVKASVNDYILRNSGIIDFEEDVIDMSEIDSSDIGQFNSEDIEDDEIAVYVIDLERIGITSATYGVKAEGDNDDVYVISKNTKTVYYKKGYEYDDHIYYVGVED